jgi:hypothetical protein
MTWGAERLKILQTASATAFCHGFNVIGLPKIPFLWLLK